MRRPNRGDVASALRELMATDMLPRLAALEPLALQPPNVFRRTHCYTREVTEALALHAEALRVLYEFYAHGSGGAANAFKDKALLGGDEWSTLLNDFDLLDTQLTERDANRCFIYSRLRVIKESTTKGRAKLLQLSLEDFYECLVRLATMKALPTDADVRGEYVEPPTMRTMDDIDVGDPDDIAALGFDRHIDRAPRAMATAAAPAPAIAGLAPSLQRLVGDGRAWAEKCKGYNAADGGDLMLKLLADGQQTWAAFLEMRKPPPFGASPLQPTSRAVHTLCCFLIRTVHSVIPDDISPSDRADLRLTPRHVRRFSSAGAKRSRPMAKNVEVGF